jgi:predicted nucleic acid-binding protein
LRGLFGQVGITDVVRDEVVPGNDRPGEAEILEALRSGWLTVVPDRRAEPRYPELDDGEASVIRAAMNLDCPCLLLIDERSGRAVARELGFQLGGTVGVIVAARRRGVVQAARPVFERLLANGFRISPALIRSALTAWGEE